MIPTARASPSPLDAHHAHHPQHLALDTRSALITQAPFSTRLSALTQQLASKSISTRHSALSTRSTQATLSSRHSVIDTQRAMYAHSTSALPCKPPHHASLITHQQSSACHISCIACIVYEVVFINCLLLKMCRMQRTKTHPHTHQNSTLSDYHSPNSTIAHLAPSSPPPTAPLRS